MSAVATAALLKLQPLESQRQSLLSQLQMWAEIEKQGVDPEEVVSFGWNSSYVPPRMWTEAERTLNPERFPWFGQWLFRSCKPLYYNYLNMKDGSIRKLLPFVKAAPKE